MESFNSYVDMTYFPLLHGFLKEIKLKIALVFIHDTVRFEVWLSGYNKKVQAEYWSLFKEHGWNKYHLPDNLKGSDSILEQLLLQNGS